MNKFIDLNTLKDANYLSLILASVAFPLILHNFQLVVGVTVNALIVYSTYKHGLKKTIPLIILPSLMALFSGIIFGPFSIFLLYFIPFIWISNFTYSRIFSKLNNYKGIILGSITKSLILLTTFFMLFGAGLVPRMFLIPMSVIQLTTALIGGFIATTIISIEKRKV